MYDPFTVPWWSAEIIAIYKDEDDEDEVFLEVRWLYRRQDLPRSMTANLVWNDEDDLEEVYESDHVDICSACSILCPVHLSSEPDAILDHDLPMPKIHFLCRHFYTVNRGSFTPCGSLSTRIGRGRMHSRILPPKELYDKKERPLTAGNEHSEAISRFTLSSASLSAFREKKLPCREKEVRVIHNFLMRMFQGEQNRYKTALFLAGPPGTGKTACVLSTLQSIQKQSTSDFHTTYINAMSLQTPYEAYTLFWESLSHHRRSPHIAAAELERYFSSSPSRQLVVILDEMDYLVTQKQTVLYNFLDWPMRTSCKMLIIGISNTLNLVERLHPRLQSRFGTDKCMFSSYTHKEINTILQTRLEDCPNVFQSEAIDFVSRKSAGLSGDLRIAFQLCRSAVEAVPD